MRRHRVIALLAGAGLILTGSGAASAAPDKSETVSAPVEEVVTIKRDEYGVPHVYAQSTRDLFFGYGYVVGEDRLFQMEMAKRSVLGTASEVAGPEALSNDRISRSNFDPSAIQKQIDALPQEQVDVLAGYADGINAKIDEVLAEKDSLLPKQFADYGFEPEHWSAYDVAMIWVGTMASRFSDSTPELANLQLREQLIDELGETKGAEMFDQLVWTEDPTAVTTVPREDDPYQDIPGEMPYDGTSSSADASEAEGALFEQPPEGSLEETAEDQSAAGSDEPSEGSVEGESSEDSVEGKNSEDSAQDDLEEISQDLDDAAQVRMSQYGGGEWPDIVPEASNVWLVGADKTHNGESIFLNGPQFGNFNPSYVFGIGLHGAGYDVVGNSPFAYPAVLFGTNNDIVWGSTAGPLDVNDVYQVTLNPEDNSQYMYEGEWRDMDLREEVISIKGEEDVVERTFSTVHGVVTSFDEEHGVAYAKRRSWDGIELQTLMTWVESTKASNWEEFLESASDMGITNNWYYADNDGNIGYVSVGRLPDRPEGQDQRVPAVGDGSMEWDGFRPFSDNPKVYNPKQGYISNWNNQSAEGFAAHNRWGPVHRVNEISARLQSQERFTSDEIWDINEETSFADLNIRYLRPYLIEALDELAEDDPLRADIEVLTDWDGQVRDDDRDGYYDGPQPVIMDAWLPRLTEAVLADALPDLIYEKYARPAEASRSAPATQLIYNAFLGQEAGVEQSIDFLNGQEPLDIVRDTYTAAISEIRDEFGNNESNWEQKAVSTHDFSPRNFMGVVQANEDEALSLPVAMNRGTQNHLVTLNGDNAEMCSVAPPGQNGFVDQSGATSAHYKDQLELYRDFECKTDHLDADQVDAHAVTEKILEPESSEEPTSSPTESPSDPPSEPGLPATGVVGIGLLAPTLALLVGGLALVLHRRRSLR